MNNFSNFWSKNVQHLNVKKRVCLLIVKIFSRLIDSKNN